MKVKSCLPLDILIFVLAGFLSSLVFGWVLTWQPMGENDRIIVGAIACAVIVAYLLLTIFPRKTKIFRDPIKGKYGLDGYRRKKS